MVIDNPTINRARIAVVSPFLDKRHGTERAVVECLSRLADEYNVHIYSQRVEDLDLTKIQWHRIPELPGPHLINYLWWFGANHIWRRCDRLLRNLAPDMTFSPGVNCLDADLISVHIVFAEFLRLVQSELVLPRNPPTSWPRLIHRPIYYRLIIWLEGKAYRRGNTTLEAVSHKVAADLRLHYDRRDEIAVIYHAFDSTQFSPERRGLLRDAARDALELDSRQFAVLIVGNDWKKKGLACLLEAARLVQRASLRLLVVGHDDPAAFTAAIAQAGLAGRVKFLPPRPDVEFYYAAADLYAGPSLEDAFSLPPAEAMACGMPVIVSRTAGVSEIITHGKDGLVLEDPTDAATLAQMIRQLCDEPEFCDRLGREAAVTARTYTWEQNAQQMRDLFERVIAQNKSKEAF
jgi:glycosyltransferase involved in cell wall biosynthesis